MGPALIPQDLRFLVVYVFSAQGLPGFSSVGVPSINALVQVQRSNLEQRRNSETHALSERGRERERGRDRARNRWKEREDERNTDSESRER